MKILALLTILTVAVILALAGCGRSNDRTQAKRVANPPQQKKAAAKHKTPEQLEAEMSKARDAKAPAAKPEAKAKPGANGWVKTDTGLEYKDIKVGKGAAAKDGESVTVHYTGWLDNGEVFDTSKKEGRGPFKFTLGAGQVIQGWDQGVKGMRVGGVRELKVPPSLGYGPQENGPIPANSTLHFKVELLKVEAE